MPPPGGLWIPSPLIDAVVGVAGCAWIRPEPGPARAGARRAPSAPVRRYELTNGARKMLVNYNAVLFYQTGQSPMFDWVNQSRSRAHTLAASSISNSMAGVLLLRERAIHNCPRRRRRRQHAGAALLQSAARRPADPSHGLRPAHPAGARTSVTWSWSP